MEQLQPGTLLPSFQQHVHAVGCIVFIPNVSLAQCDASEIRQVYYSYDFGDRVTVKDLTEPNTTHCYNESGVYNYSLNAIAVVNSTLRFHANLSDYITLLGKFFDECMMHCYAQIITGPYSQSNLPLFVVKQRGSRHHQ